MASLMPRTLHRSDRPSLTAQATTLARALELDRPAPERIVTDEYAPVLLPALGRRSLATLRSARPAVRLAERSGALGIATSSLCRHRFIDDHLLDALPGVEQVLVLGAGYDSRAYRFASEIARRPVFEVDLPPLSRAKRAAVAARPELFGPTRVTSVEVDFRTEKLADRLAASTFTTGAPTFVAWEGVSMYLSPDALRGTLDALGEVCGPGSTVAMDFWQRTGRSPARLLHRAGELSVGLIGEPLTCAVDVHRVGELLGRSGFEVSDLATAEAMDERYATGGRRCDDAMYTVAATSG